MKKFLLITSLFFNAALFAAGTAIVVRAHPYLTRGLEKEALIGMYFATEWNSAKMGDFSVCFRCVDCSPSDITNIEVWKMPKEVAYAFCENQAIKLEAKVSENVSGNTKIVRFSDFPTVQNYPIYTINSEKNRFTSDYIWITAKINSDIVAKAKIYTDIVESQISVSGDCEVTNGVASSPHRVFPYYYKSGAYFRADRVTDKECKPLQDETKKRLESLNDLILINDLEPVYDAATGKFSTTWNTRKKTDGTIRNNSASMAYVKSLCKENHPSAMVRIGLTKNDTKMTMNGETAHPLAFAVSTPKYRAQLIAEIVKIMEETGVDGLDVDWEYPGVNSGSFTTNATWERDWHNYGLFLRDLAAVFFDHGWVLSMCTNLGWTMPSDATMSSNRTKFMGVLHVPDYIDSMAYGDPTLNAAPLVMQKAVKAITDCGVPKRRIVVGQAMYAYEVQNPGWDSVVEWLKEAYPDAEVNYQQRRWDADLVWKHRQATKADGTLVSTEKETFEGPSSYHAKIAWCREHDMGGAMSWGYYTDVVWEDEHLMSLGRHHAKSLPMIANLPATPNKEGAIYLIETEQDWNWLAKHQNVQAKLTKDITFSCDPMMIFDWTGKLDGQNHTLTIPKDVWVAHETSSGLFKWIRGGSVKNLTINLGGRVITRASRWNDINVEKDSEESTCQDDVYVGVLAAEVRASSTIENVTINIKEGAEVQGVYRTGGLAGNVYAPDTAKLVITNCTVSAKGTVHNLNINSSETVISLSDDAEVSSLVGHVQRPPNVSAITIYITNAFVINPDNSVSMLDSSDKLVAASSNQVDAYLLNCAVDDLPTKKAAFKLSITINDAGKPVVSAPEGYNGTLKILGAVDLTGPWSEDFSDDVKFFKAELNL